MGKNIKENVIYLYKQQIKDAVAYLSFNCYFTVSPRIICLIIGIPMASDPVPFFADLFFCFYESKWMNEQKKNDIIKARKLCNVLIFIDYLNTISDGGEFESNYSNISPEELQLGKKNTDKHEAIFLDLNFKIKDGKLHFGLFDKRDSFTLCIVRMPGDSSNVTSSIVYFAIGAGSLRIARASNNPKWFYTAMKSLKK